MQIIDFHVHGGDFFRLRDDIQDLLTRRPLEPGADVRQIFSQREAMKAYLQGYGVSRAVVLAECGPGTNFSIDSEMIVALTGQDSGLIPFGSINPNFHADPVAEWRRSVELGVRGFKFYPADHGFDPMTPGMTEVYGLCALHGLPVMFHTGTTAQKDAEQKYIHPRDFEPIIAAHRGMPVILAHAGKPTWYADALELTESYENVYVDTALVDVRALLEFGVETRRAADKILFGSDWPVCGSYAAVLERARNAGMSQRLAQKVFHDNAAALLGLH
ncbi:amidohydrolase family protein [Aquabacterium sp. A7-Y]|uniref:amidohydrolase family protein n=1 Tax=Aquabacterium sp. A7-Y TaxID=1349605 RepID=UPI00223D841B|nr:amidohydrolase family protein [Aquabacterium sp. A7-Y]MCW7536898.1 amidohydrolase family protein [Aquabacterium sp. A7-Y]